MGRKRKQFVSLLLILVLIIGSCVPVSAASISSTYAKAYAKKLNTIIKKNSKSVNKSAEVIIRDMNGDKKPELLVNLKPYGSTPGAWVVYSYQNKKVKKIGSFTGSLYKISGKKNKYRCESWTGIGAYKYGYVTFSKNKVTSQKVWSCGGYPTNYYKYSNEVSASAYNKGVKTFRKYMTSKRYIKTTALTNKTWTVAKVKKVCK